VNASPALVSSFVLCGKANRRTSKIMGRWRMGKQQGTLLLFSLSTALSLAVMTSAHAPNNTSYSFRRFRSIRPKGSSLASPRRTNSKEQLCHWMMLFIIKLEKPHEPKERWLRAVCACVFVCVHLIAHPSGWFGEYEETHPPLYVIPVEEIIKATAVCRLCVCVYVCVVMVLFDACVLSVFVEGVFWWWRAVGRRRKGGICLRRDLPLQCNIIPFSPGFVSGQKLKSWEPCCDALAPLPSISLFDCFEAHLGLVPQRVSINRVIPLPPLMSFYGCVCVFASEV
jgi:hypothetical protein